MPHLPRRILPRRLYEITDRTFQSRYFFVPSKELNLLIAGAIAYAQRKYQVTLHWVTFLSNHSHVILTAGSEQQVADFLCLAKTQISKEVQKLHSRSGWTGGIYDPDGADITDITDEPEAQIKRLRYMLEQGVKEGLVPHPTKWPGIQSASACLDGTMKIPGLWVDRSQLYDLERAAKGRKVKAVRKWLTKAEKKSCEESISIELTPLPCLQDLSETERRRLVADLCADIVRENQDKIARITKGWRKQLMDRKRFARRPQWTKKADRPKVHAATEETWICWMRELEAFLTRYDRASRRLRAGIAEALEEFPEGCFIPSGVSTKRRGLPPPVTAS